MNKAGNKTYRSGAALLVVMFVVMVGAILAVGFIATSNVEMACGQNMALKTQMDHLAESGLVHARGLLLNPQDVDTETYGCWTGAGNQQLVSSSSDWYEVGITRDLSDNCNYVIDCNAYRIKDSEQIGRSSLRAELRLNPCIAFWAGTSTTLANSVIIDGDVYCNGTLTNDANINGDVFTNGINGSGSYLGQSYLAADANLSWPGNIVSVSDFSDSLYYVGTSMYGVKPVDANSYSGSWLPPEGYNPKKIYYYDPALLGGNLELCGNVNIEGTLVVDANLVISGAGNSIDAEKNFPALLVSGELVIRDGGELQIDGLAMVTEQVIVDPLANNFSLDINGGLFIQNGGLSAPSSATERINISASPQKAAIREWPAPPGDPVDWSQASGAFFKSITMMF